MFFRLHSHCHIVKGAKRGAIYNVHSGKVLSINKGALELITECQSSPLENLMDISDPNNQIFLKFLNDLISKELGSMYILEPDNSTTRAEQTNEQTLEFLWLELTSNCNNRCLHCYATSGPCQTTDKVSLERWLSLISEARQIGATAIQLIGGEPLLYPNWRQLIEKASQEGYDYIEVFTNATTLTDNDIEFFKQYNVNVATTIYADNAAVHDQITLNPGSFAKTFSNIKKILAADLPLRIASIIMKPNENEVENIMKLCGELGVEVNPPDVVRPTGRGDDKDLLPKNYSKPPIKPPFHTDNESFARATTFHSCLAGKLAITSDGDVIPCIFARNQACGNILEKSLKSIVHGEALQQCWRTTKDKVEKCKDCEYRYACGDCRPLAQGSDSSKRWLACSSECSYNPYTGVWEEK